MRDDETLWNLVRCKKMFWVFSVSVVFLAWLVLSNCVKYSEEKEKVRQQKLYEQLVQQKITER